MEKLTNKLLDVHWVSNEKLTLLSSKLECMNLTRGDILFSPERKHHYINFLEKGAVRAFSYHHGKETTFWFGLEGDMVFPYYSYLQDKVSYETVELLEDCIIYRILMSDFKQLFNENLEWANWGRKFAEKQMVFLEERFIDYQVQTAAQRYEKLLSEHPELFHRIKLQHLASYLRMSQVSLSRIRAGVQ